MYSFKVLIVSCLVVVLLAGMAVAQCPNNCNNRGLCVNNACVCAEGLTGSDCSSQVQSIYPSLYACPTCYQVTVGSPTYITGPSWRLPDGPIIGLNNKGNLSVYQGNGDGEMISSGLSINDFLPSPIVSLAAGTGSNFDSCGSWLMRAFTTPSNSGKVVGFYHSETQCIYSNNGQTRKSAGYAVSYDGGKTFTKPNYPNNKFLDTNSPIAIGKPSGEGDISVVLKGNYYYMLFANVENWTTGIARASVASDAAPGSWFKYLNGNWNSPALGGDHTGLGNVAGTQFYLHTPSQSFVSLGANNPYWNEGTMMSVSDNGTDWKYFADPLITPDQTTNPDTIMYPSFLGTTGPEIGNSFKMYYMWLAPYSPDWTHRYQISKDITLTYVGADSTVPRTKIALTTFRSPVTQETWQTTELADTPYKAVGIVGYLMSRAYPNTFALYDCFNYTSNDHFIGTTDECMNSGSGILVLRPVGHIWSTRMYANSIAVYRCAAGSDLFLSSNTQCDGLAPAQTVPFGYVMDGPAFVLTQDTVIPQGSSWKYVSYTPASNWMQPNFADSAWPVSVSPFGNGYQTSVSSFGATPYYFRYYFNIPAGKTVKSLVLSVSSDDYATVYLNGVMVDSDVVTWHEASYWNRKVYISTASLVSGNNVLAVKVQNADNWAYFDLTLQANYNVPSSKRSISEEVEEIVLQQAAEKAEPVEPVKEVASVTKRPSVARSVEKRAGPTTLVATQTQWKYVSWQPAASWTTTSFDDSTWPQSAAPFVNNYASFGTVQGLMYTGGGSFFGASNYYFRQKFTVVPGNTATSMTISVASDNNCDVYVNGVLIGQDPVTWHPAAYYNKVWTFTPSMVVPGINTVAIIAYNNDQWAFFDASVVATLVASVTPSPTLAPSGGTFIAKGSSWAYTNVVPAANWNQNSFSQWLPAAQAPFMTVVGYPQFSTYSLLAPGVDYYFRSQFTVPSASGDSSDSDSSDQLNITSLISSLTVSVASDNYAMVYVNGVLVDYDIVTWHAGAYWNRVVTFAPNMLVSGVNTIGIIMKNTDNWAFFDAQLTYAGGSGFTGFGSSGSSTPVPTSAPSGSGGSGSSSSSTCGVKGQMTSGVCVCDQGWGGAGCNTNLCTYSSATTQTIVPQGSSYLHTQWATSQLSTTPKGWNGNNYADTWWSVNNAPFGTTNYGGISTVVNGQRHLYRKKFTMNVPWNNVLQYVTLSISSEDIHRVWINGKFVDTAIFPYLPHTGKQNGQWNTVIQVDPSLFSTTGTNTVAIEIPMIDGRWWTYFDMQMVATYAVKACTSQ